MTIEKTNNGFIARGCEHFNVLDTLACGQVFRCKKTGSNSFRVLSSNRLAELEAYGDTVTVNTSDAEYFYNYFDLSRDYGKIISNLSSFSELKEAIAFGKGIRILNQNLFETIVSFIISANNNIPRIQGIIEKICLLCGEKLPSGDFGFPNIAAMSQLKESDFRAAGAGFRAPYLVETTSRINNDDFLSDIIAFKQSEENAALRCDGLVKRLLSLKGVGRKVADCILLFGLHESSSFPTDTWVFQSSKTEELCTVEKVRSFYSERYGSLSGYAQQYLFYFERSKKKQI